MSSQKKANMLTQKYVSLKELNLLKRKNVLAGANGKSIMNINKPIVSEMDEMDMILDKEKSTCQKNIIAAKQNLLPQKMNDEQMEKGNDEFKDRSEIKTIIGKKSSINKDGDKIIVEDVKSPNC
jgi:hypothetical protein